MCIQMRNYNELDWMAYRNESIRLVLSPIVSYKLCCRHKYNVHTYTQRKRDDFPFPFSLSPFFIYQWLVLAGVHCVRVLQYDADIRHFIPSFLISLPSIIVLYVTSIVIIFHFLLLQYDVTTQFVSIPTPSKCVPLQVRGNGMRERKRINECIIKR